MMSGAEPLTFSLLHFLFTLVYQPPHPAPKIYVQSGQKANCDDLTVVIAKIPRVAEFPSVPSSTDIGRTSQS